MKRMIECKYCDNWEEIDDDAPRWNAQSFEWIKDDKFKCKCGNIICSHYIVNFEEDI